MLRRKVSALKRSILGSPSREVEMTLQPTTELCVDSAVQVDDPPKYGVLRWIGTFPGSDEQRAGIELDERTDECGDGKFEENRYFKCEFGHGHFCLLELVQPDQRFLVIDTPPPEKAKLKKGTPPDNPLQVPLVEEEDQTTIPSAGTYVGEPKGIQGNHNSCYLDATLFGLFALSDVFDSIFLGVVSEKATDPNRKKICDLLAKRIVNPLRKNGVVRFESVMELRTKIEEFGKMEGIMKMEKDPEEFLNMLFKHILHAPPFITIKRQFGVEDEFFIQLFVSFDENLRLPTMRGLLKQMFDESELSLTKVPSRLLIQVPRYGKQFKTCQRIVPDKKFDVTEFTDSHRDNVVTECMICGRRSLWKCSECKKDFKTDKDEVYFCEICCSRAHEKKERAKHEKKRAVEMDVAELDLLSVICIETSHYVCFTRDFKNDKWIFFDSMADRVYDTYNIPKVTDCTRELNEWVYSGDRTRLMSTQPRQLPELVRRFTQDIYMCVYVQPDPAIREDEDDNSCC